MRNEAYVWQSSPCGTTPHFKNIVWLSSVKEIGKRGNTRDGENRTNPKAKASFSSFILTSNYFGARSRTNNLSLQLCHGSLILCSLLFAVVGLSTAT
jgi:hypothetical protein